MFLILRTINISCFTSMRLIIYIVFYNKWLYKNWNLFSSAQFDCSFCCEITSHSYFCCILNVYMTARVYALVWVKWWQVLAKVSYWVSWMSSSLLFGQPFVIGLSIICFSFQRLFFVSFFMQGHFVFHFTNSMPEVRESAGLAFSTLYKVLFSGY